MKPGPEVRPEVSAFPIEPIGHVESPLTEPAEAPKQGSEGSPPAWLVFSPEYQEGLADLKVGDEILVLTWLHLADRQTLRVRPRDDQSAPLRGVFSTRSQDRPNPLGLHRVRIIDTAGPTRFQVADLEAVDGTPIIEVKPILDADRER